eukprot:403376728
MAVQTITRILLRAQSSSYTCGLNQIRNHSKLQKNKQQLFNSTLESFNDLMSDMLRQRYYSAFSAFKQHSLLKVHQRQVLIRTLLKSRTKGLKFFMKKWVSQIAEMKNQGEQNTLLRIKQGKVLKSLAGQQETKRKTVAFYQWQKTTQEVITQQKVALTIRAMASASRIFDLFSQHSLIRKCLKQWREQCHSVDSIQLGLQLLNTTYKRKMKTHLRAIIQQAKKKKHNKKSSKVKALLIFQVLTRIFQNRQHQALGALKCKSISVKADNDKIQLKQKKKEIHNQIVLLTEKDQKIRKQEAFLSMKEQKISEQEKEIKDKQKRIAEISKNAKEQARKLESKSPMSKTPTANGSIKHPNQTFQSNSQYIQQQLQTQQINVVPKIQVDISDNQPKKSTDNLPLQKDVRSSQRQLNFNYTQNQSFMSNQLVIGKENNSTKSSTSLSKFHSQHNSSQNVQQASLGLRKQSYLSKNPQIQSSVTSLQSNITDLSQSQQLSSRIGTQDMRIGGGSIQLDNVQMKLYKVALCQLTNALQKIYQEKSVGMAFNMIRDKTIWDRQREGAQYMIDICSRKQLSEALIKWLRSVYEEEIYMQQSIEVIREKKLLRALMIVENSQRKDEVLLMRAFKEWKRIEYQMVLEGLMKYSATLEKNHLNLQQLNMNSNYHLKQSYNSGGFMPKTSEKRYYK